MKRIFAALMLLILLAFGISVHAQTDAGSSSTVTIFFVACDNQAVLNLNGTMEAGLDLYYQVFSGPQGTGTALTNIRQVQVDGTYAFSENVSFTGGTIPAGSTGSATVYMGREGNANSVLSDKFLVDDLQDGCNNPQNALATSVDTGAGGAGAVAGTTTSTVGKIRSPFGGFINPDVTIVPQDIVVIGARQDVDSGRSATPGILFAECDKFASAAPGVLYDNDNIVIFWSWFARTQAQVQDHIAKAQYNVKLNTAPLVEVGVSAIEKRTTNYWVFYTANIGRLKPGQYGVEYNLTWSEAHFDGFNDYGPGTDRPSEGGTCTFTITPNPDNQIITNYNTLYSLR